MALIIDSIEVANTAGGSDLLREFCSSIRDWILNADLGYEVVEDLQNINENTGSSAVFVCVLKHTVTGHYIGVAAAASSSTFAITLSGNSEIESNGYLKSYKLISNIQYRVSDYHFKCSVMLARHDSNNFVIGFLNYSERCYFFKYGVSQTTDIEGNILNTYIITCGASSSKCLYFGQVTDQNISDIKVSYEALGTGKQATDLTRCIIQPAILINYNTSIINTDEIPKNIYNTILPQNINTWTLVEISGERYLLLNFPNFAYKVD